MKRLLHTALALLLLSSLLTSCSVRRTIRYTANAGKVIAGAFAVAGRVVVVKEYAASEEQKTAAKEKALAMVAALPPEKVEPLKKEPRLLVEVPRDDRADKATTISVMIFDTSSQTVVGNKV
jgi:hypothetical protein